MEDIQLGKGFFVKDHHFYKGNENTWNRPSWSSAKTFGFYHKDNLQKTHQLKSKMEYMIKENQAYQAADGQDRINRNRQQSLSRLVERKVERLVIQNKCNQQVETNPNEHAISKIESLNPQEVSKCVMNKSGVRNLLKSGSGNLWNDFNRMSAKSVKLLIPRSIISNDEKATSLIMSKIQEERTIRSEQAHRQQSTHRDIYSYEKSLKNKNATRQSGWRNTSTRGPQSSSQFEITGGPAKSTLPQLGKGTLERIDENQANHQSSMVAFDETERLAYLGQTGGFSTGRNTQNSLKHVNLSQTHRAREPDLTVRTEEYSEFKGLHVPILNKDSASMNVPYTRFVLSNSELARERLANEYCSKGSISELDRHCGIRTARKIQSHLPDMKGTSKKSKPIKGKPSNLDLMQLKPQAVVPGEEFDSKQVSVLYSRMCLRS